LQKRIVPSGGRQAEKPAPQMQFSELPAPSFWFRTTPGRVTRTPGGNNRRIECGGSQESIGGGKKEPALKFSNNPKGGRRAPEKKNDAKKNWFGNNQKRHAKRGDARSAGGIFPREKIWWCDAKLRPPLYSEKKKKGFAEQINGPRCREWQCVLGTLLASVKKKIGVAIGHCRKWPE